MLFVVTYQTEAMQGWHKPPGVKRVPFEVLSIACDYVKTLIQKGYVLVTITVEEPDGD